MATVQGISARTLASIASQRLGRKVTDKRVRAIARDTIERFGDDAYTAHAYTPAEAAGIVTHLAGSGRSASSMSAADAATALAAVMDTPAPAPVAAPESKGKATA